MKLNRRNFLTRLPAVAVATGGVVSHRPKEIIDPLSSCPQWEYDPTTNTISRRVSQDVIVELDGKELARAVVEYLPSAIRRRGLP